MAEVEEVHDVQSRYLELAEFIKKDLDPSNRLKKEKMEKLETIISKWAFAQAELQGEIKLLKKENDKLKNDLATKQALPLYSAVAATSMKPSDKRMDTIQRISKTQTTTLFITSKTNEDIKEIEKHFFKALNPAKHNIKIKAIRKTPKNLIIETENQKDAEKIINDPEIKKSLVCEPPKKRKPLMILYHVPTTLAEEEMLEYIYKQNFTEHISEDEFKEGFTPRFKTGPRDKETVHLVVEVAPKLRNILLNQRRVYVSFCAIDIKDYIVVPRCQKCQDIGHVAKHCQSKEEVCGHCGAEGHKKPECPKKTETAICVPCRGRKKKCGKECPTLKMMTERLISKTDYGY